MRNFSEYINEVNKIFIGSLGQKTEKVVIKEVPIAKVLDFLEDREFFFDDMVDEFGIDIQPNDNADDEKMINALKNGKLCVTWDLDGDGVVGTSTNKTELKKALIKEFGD